MSNGFQTGEGMGRLVIMRRTYLIVGCIYEVHIIVRRYHLDGIQSV
jgi:hypothetical protein